MATIRIAEVQSPQKCNCGKDAVLRVTTITNKKRLYTFLCVECARLLHDKIERYT